MPAPLPHFAMSTRRKTVTRPSLTLSGLAQEAQVARIASARAMKLATSLREGWRSDGLPARLVGAGG